MNTLFIYMIKVSAYLTAFYMVYAIMLSRDTSYVRNRTYILLSLAFSLIFPVISFQTNKPIGINYFGYFLSDVLISASRNSTTTSGSVSLVTNFFQLIYLIYIIGVIGLVIKLLADLSNLFFLIIHKRNRDNHIIVFHGFNTAGFSAMGYIFINVRLNEEEAREIIKHEQYHLEQNHFIDIIFVEIVKAVQWFNPVVYLFNRSLRAIHEYQADQGCINSGIPVINYQSLLFSQVFKTGSFNLTNSFSNPSLIRKRMIMLTKKRTSALANIKVIAVLPVVGFVLLSVSAFRDGNTLLETKGATISKNLKPLADNYSVNLTSPPTSMPAEKLAVKSDDLNEVPFVAVEEMPVFPGGDSELLKFIGKNTTYPEIAKKNNIQGRVIIRFCITEKGEINRIAVLKGVDPELDAEAMRVVGTLPAFKPGRQSGKAVPVWYMVPITFTLK